MYKKYFNWGLFPSIISEKVDQTKLLGLESIDTDIIARGMGRCYGDANLSKKVVETKSWNKIIEFNSSLGIINCESGVTLDEILRLIVPLGYFLPVTPGTKFVTVGGALASDIHGKNHHVDGVFSDFVEEFDLINQENKLVNVRKGEPLFYETAGSLGLTGIITRVSFRLKKIETAYIKQVSYRAKNLTEIFSLFEKHSNSTYSVAWIDCLAKGEKIGKSVLLLGEPLSVKESSGVLKDKLLKVHGNPGLNIPFFFPSWVLNSLSIKIFNWLYYLKPSSVGERVVHYDPYFYPLDKINNWNRIYGKQGFVQWQCVLPMNESKEGMQRILEILSKHKLGSFLAVLKLFGEAHENRGLHFPMRGYTLALDIKINKRIWPILDELDNEVSKRGGKIYLTKDARMNHENFSLQYPNHIKGQYPFKSHQMIRLEQDRKEVVLVVGANSDIAKAIIKQYFEKNPELFFILTSRNKNSLIEFCEKIGISDRSEIIEMDLLNQLQCSEFVSKLNYKPKEILWAAGIMYDNEECKKNSCFIDQMVEVNCSRPMRMITELIEQNNPFLKRVVAISSIAGLRGRKSNYYYGSSKAALHQFLFGLRQELSERNIIIQALTPGAVHTKMTAHMKLPGIASTTLQVAKSYHNDKKSFEIFPDLKWKLIGLIVKYAPIWVVKKL